MCRQADWAKPADIKRDIRSASILKDGRVVFSIDLPDAVEAIRYHMEQSGLQPRDLIPYIGSRNRARSAESAARAHAQHDQAIT
jgi:HTH-type transcriptional regulator/antitoxin HigA